MHTYFYKYVDTYIYLPLYQSSAFLELRILKTLSLHSYLYSQGKSEIITTLGILFPGVMGSALWSKGFLSVWHQGRWKGNVCSNYELIMVTGDNGWRLPLCSVSLR